MKVYTTLALVFFVIISVVVIGCAQESPMIKEETKKSVSEPERTYVEAKPETKYVAVEPEPAEPMLSGEDRAIEIIKKYVTSMSGYKSQRGRKLTLSTPVHSGCEGCWIIDLTYHRNMLYYPDKTEIVKMSVYLDDWEVDRYDFS